MKSYVLTEGVLNDDTIEIAEKGEYFRLPKHPVVRVTYWTFATAWSNHKHVFYACSVENALRRYRLETGRGKDSLAEYHDMDADLLGVDLDEVFG